MDPDEFLDVVAHELKTPLTPLKAVAQLIRMRLKRARDGQRELDIAALDRSAVMVERQVDRMDHLVNGLLEVSRIARGRFALRPERFDVCEVTAEAVRRGVDPAEEEDQRHRIAFDAAGPTWLVGDRARVAHVIGDLVVNAVKFSPSGGRIDVSVQGGDGEVAVTVRDEGVGIEPDEIAAMGSAAFVRGRRAEGVEEGGRYAGLGVGLYLARIVAEGHGGRLELSSEGKDRGTTATLTLRDMPEQAPNP